MGFDVSLVATEWFLCLFCKSLPSEVSPYMCAWTIIFLSLKRILGTSFLKQLDYAALLHSRFFLKFCCQKSEAMGGHKLDLGCTILLSSLAPSLGLHRGDPAQGVAINRGVGISFDARSQSLELREVACDSVASMLPASHNRVGQILLVLEAYKQIRQEDENYEGDEVSGEGKRKGNDESLQKPIVSMS